jgi:hypothetical protein
VSLDPNRPIVPQQFDPAPPEPMAASSVPTSAVAPSPVSAAPPPVLPARKKSSGGRWLNAVLGVALAVAIAGVAFAVGRTTAPASAATGTGRGGFGGQFPGGSFVPRASGQPGGGRGGFGGAFGGGAGAGLTVSGTVMSVDGDTMTIKTASGATIQVTTDSSTTYNTQAPASATDVAAGKTVQVQLDITGGGGFGRPSASGAPAGPTGTASSVTVVP